MEDRAMKWKLWGLLLVSTVLGLAQPVWGDDGFYVIAGSRGVGTPITPNSQSIVITKPGFYYLTGNIIWSGAVNPVTIGADEVTLDLMGFSISGSGPSNQLTGIDIMAFKDIEVRNGSVKGFQSGVSQTGGLNTRIANLRVNNCGYGIIMGGAAPMGIVITGCQVTGSTYDGIFCSGSCLIDKNTACYNTNANGFDLTGTGVVTNNVAYSNGKGFILSNTAAQLVDRNSSYLNTTNWTGLDGCTKGLNTPP